MPPPLVIAVSVCADQRMASATSAPIAVSRERTVVLRLSSSTAVVPIGVSRWRPRSASYFATTSAISGSGVTTAVSITRNCGHQVTRRLPSSSLTSIATSIAVT